MIGRHSERSEEFLSSLGRHVNESANAISRSHHARNLRLDNVEDIAIALTDKFPDLDPYTVALRTCTNGLPSSLVLPAIREIKRNKTRGDSNRVA